jgi:hypothetical protein
VTLLNEKGIPTPLAHVMLRPPQSRMDILSDTEIQNLISGSKLAGKYNEKLDSHSAYEMLNQKLQEAEKRTEEIKQQKELAKEEKRAPKKEKSILDNPMVRSAGRTAVTMITRSLLGVLGLGGRRRRRS